jgi:ABC-type transport system substrate-binding protein
MMSPKVLEAGDAACAAHPVGTGQYKFVEWESGHHLTVELNPDWWGYEAGLADADAGFKSVTFDVVTESSTRVSGVQSGDYQFIWPVPTESYQTLESDSNVNVFLKRQDPTGDYMLFRPAQANPLQRFKVEGQPQLDFDYINYITDTMLEPC